jgi:hypothetical protein
VSFKRIYGLDDPGLDRVFPRTRPTDIGLIESIVEALLWRLDST